MSSSLRVLLVTGAPCGSLVRCISWCSFINHSAPSPESPRSRRIFAAKHHRTPRTLTPEPSAFGRRTDDHIIATSHHQREIYLPVLYSSIGAPGLATVLSKYQSILCKDASCSALYLSCYCEWQIPHPLPLLGLRPPPPGFFPRFKWRPGGFFPHAQAHWGSCWAILGSTTKRRRHGPPPARGSKTSRLRVGGTFGHVPLGDARVALPRLRLARRR